MHSVCLLGFPVTEQIFRSNALCGKQALQGSSAAETSPRWFTSPYFRLIICCRHGQPPENCLMPLEPLPVCVCVIIYEILLVLVRIMWRLGVSHKEHSRAWKRSPLLPTMAPARTCRTVRSSPRGVRYSQATVSYLIDEWVVLVLPCQ